MNATESFRNMFKKYELSKFFSNLLAIENSKQNTRLLSVELERDWRKFVEVTFVFGGIIAFLIFPIIWLSPAVFNSAIILHRLQSKRHQAISKKITNDNATI